MMAHVCVEILVDNYTKKAWNRFVVVPRIEALALPDKIRTDNGEPTPV